MAEAYMPAIAGASPSPVDPTADGAYPDASLLMRMFDDFRNVMQQARTEQDVDQDYYDGKQLSPKDRSVLARRRQPATIRNRIKPAVNGTIGVAERGKTDPRAYPRNPGDENASDVATDVLRYVSDMNRFGQAKLMVLKDMLIRGECGTVIEIGDDMEVILTQIRAEEFFYDPRSRRDDFKDARYMGIAKWMAGDVLESMYPDMKEAIQGALSTGICNTNGDSLFPDKPKNALPWFNQRERRLLVCEMYHQEGTEWKRSVFCGSTILESGPSPYVDDKGRTLNAIEAQSGYVDRDNRRYGMVRDMRSPQDEINARASKSLHVINSRQVQQVDPTAPPIDADIARAEAARPDGVIPSGWQIVPTNDVFQGNLALMQEAKSEIERMAPIPSLVGRADSSASGRAQLVQSQAGMTELALLFAGFSDWERRVYVQTWNRVRQFWDDEKFIRVTDDEGAPKFVKVNEIVEPAIYAQGPDGQPMIGQDGKPVVLRPAVINNRLAEMNVDIIVDSVPDTANVQQEQFSELMGLIQANPTYAQQVPFKVALGMSSIVKKRELVQQLDQYQGEAQQTQAQAAELAAKKTGSEIEKNAASAENDRAQARERNLGAAVKTFSAANSMEGQQPPPGMPPQGDMTGVSGLPADQGSGPPL